MASLTQWLKFWLGAQTRYQVHSPFVFQFVTQILPHRASKAGNTIEGLRKEYLRNSTELEILDFGAGYGGEAAPIIRKTVGQVTRGSGRRRRTGELLYRMGKNYQPRLGLELGTNLGFSGLYQAFGMAPGGRFVTLEGAPALATQAQGLFQRVHLPVKPEIRVGEFQSSLDHLFLDPAFSPDWVFLDGNHRFEPTLEYFRQIVDRMPEGSLMLLDDIHWSREMEMAWNEVIKDPRVSVSMDLYWLGILFIKRPQAKEHFRFRFIP